MYYINAFYERMNEIKSFITSIEAIPTVSPSDLLGAVLENVSSSTDPLLVFNDKKEYCGAVSPSYVLFKRRYPTGTKVQSAMIMTPHITSQSSIFEVAEHMLATEIYTLPVFEGIDLLVGVVRGKDLIRGLMHNKELLREAQSMLEIKKPLTATMHMSVGEVYSTLKNEKSSRIVVVNNTGVLEGIVTRRDIQNAFLAPGPGRSSVNFSQEDVKRFDFPISEFYNTNVVTIGKGATIKEIIECMLAHSVNSVVIVDRVNKPVGIVSVRSLLLALTKVRPAPQIQIELSDRHNIMIDGQKENVMDILSRFVMKESKRVPLLGVEYILEAVKNPKGKIIAYEPSLFIQFANGEKYGTKVSNKNLFAATKEAVKKIASQEETIKGRYEH